VTIVSGSVEILRSAWRTSPWRLTAIFALVVANYASWPLAPLVLKHVTDAVVHHDAHAATRAAVFLPLVALVITIGWHFLHVLFVEIADRNNVTVTGEIAELAQGPPGLAHLERPDYADKLELIRNETGWRYMSVRSAVTSIGILVQLGFTVVLLARLQPLLLLLLAFAVPPLLGTRYAWRAWEKEWVANGDRLRHAAHLIDLALRADAAKEVRVFGLEDELRSRLRALVGEMRAQGTTTVEIKSGYGLTVADEARSLRIARELTEETTFLGAHVVPDGVEPDDYVELVCGPMLDAAAPYARWVDVFCDRGAFERDQAAAVLTAGAKRGLGVRIHASQLAPGPGVLLAVELGAASADHCTHLTGADVDALAGGTTVATLLPGAEFSTRSSYPDARRLIDAGVTVALATDCNPGSSYTTSMPFCIALAVREMRMTPAEAVWAATAGGARALRHDDIGVLRPGARADLMILNAPSHLHLAYRPGVPLVRTVLHNGVPS
jgi:imidazolonepropionase